MCPTGGSKGPGYRALLPERYLQRRTRNKTTTRVYKPDLMHASGMHRACSSNEMAAPPSLHPKNEAITTYAILSAWMTMGCQDTRNLHARDAHDGKQVPQQAGAVGPIAAMDTLESAKEPRQLPRPRTLCSETLRSVPLCSESCHGPLPIGAAILHQCPPSWIYHENGSIGSDPRSCSDLIHGKPF